MAARELAPTFQWGNRIGTPPPNLAYPAFLNTNPTQDVSVSLTKVVGRHTMKAGFYSNHSLKQQNLNQRNACRSRETLSFANDTNNPLDTGFGFANAALGVYTAYTQQSSFVEGKFVYNQIEGYAQDNWKVNSKLTLDYGLRFTHQVPQYDANGQASNFFLDRYSRASAPAQYQPGCPGGVFPCESDPAGDESADRDAHGTGHGRADRPDRAGHRQSDQRHRARRRRHLEVQLRVAGAGHRAALRGRLRRLAAGRRWWCEAASACSSIGRTATPSITSRRTRRRRPTRPCATDCCRRWERARWRRAPACRR